jgi:hypothetical protein
VGAARGREGLRLGKEAQDLAQQALSLIRREEVLRVRRAIEDQERELSL